jgi:hypothetical protein
MTAVGRFLLGLLVGLVVLAGPWADTAQAQWKKLPWHLVDHYYRMPEIADFRTLSIDLDLQGHVEPGQFVYIAALNGKISGDLFYFGFQSDLWNTNQRKSAGKGIIFSRWGKADKADARPTAPGWAESLTDSQSGEGDFASIRLPFDWQQGRYVFRVETRSAAPRTGLWADLAVIDKDRNRRIDVGSLRFPATPPVGFDPLPASFVEIYGKLPRSATDPQVRVAPDFTVRFAPPLVNGAILPIGNDFHQSRRVPPLARLTRGADFGASVVVGGTVAAQ